MGNSSNSTTFYPAKCNHALAVGATSINDTRAIFSTYGSWISVTAPGVSIYGLDRQSDTNYGTSYSGTSQATPHVAGLASLLLSFSPDQLKSIIETTADDQVGGTSEYPAGFDQYMGWGRINAYKALQKAQTISGIRKNGNEELSRIIIYPNPFTSSVIISYYLPEISDVKIDIYNAIGEQVQFINKGTMSPGNYTEQWNGNHGNQIVPAGFYFGSITMNGTSKLFFKMVKAG